MFNALIARQTEAGQSVALETLEFTDLPDNDVLVRVDYSTINYKDGLALTGAAPIIRSYPLVPGIDLAGVVESSRDQRWQVGDRVVVNGWGMGEGHWGGLAQYAQVKGDWRVKLPDARGWGALVRGASEATSYLPRPFGEQRTYSKPDRPVSHHGRRSSCRQRPLTQ